MLHHPLLFAVFNSYLQPKSACKHYIPRPPVSSAEACAGAVTRAVVAALLSMFSPVPLSQPGPPLLSYLHHLSPVERTQDEAQGRLLLHYGCRYERHSCELVDCLERSVVDVVVLKRW